MGTPLAMEVNEAADAHLQLHGLKQVCTKSARLAPRISLLAHLKKISSIKRNYESQQHFRAKSKLFLRNSNSLKLR